MASGSSTSADTNVDARPKAKARKKKPATIATSSRGEAEGEEESAPATQPEIDATAPVVAPPIPPFPGTEESIGNWDQEMAALDLGSDAAETPEESDEEAKSKTYTEALTGVPAKPAAPPPPPPPTEPRSPQPQEKRRKPSHQQSCRDHCVRILTHRALSAFKPRSYTAESDTCKSTSSVCRSTATVLEGRTVHISTHRQTLCAATTDSSKLFASILFQIRHTRSIRLHWHQRISTGLKRLTVRGTTSWL